MIIVDYKPYIDQLKAIDAKSYEWPWCEEGWKDTNGYIFRILVKEKDVVIGYSCVKLDFSKLLVVKLCVRPCFRKLGFGSSLMRDLLMFAKSKGVIRLSTILHEENQFIKWARNWDWKGTGIKKGLFPDGRDGYIFERKVL